mmetsp:Transcript_29265/g.56540  ORF Transcript_29265/g.56540 Transcript_29265/m.56540 type:complete len:125 (+) Transcript_29265:965-1339(+)
MTIIITTIIIIIIIIVMILTIAAMILTTSSTIGIGIGTCFARALIQTKGIDSKLVAYALLSMRTNRCSGAPPRRPVPFRACSMEVTHFVRESLRAVIRVGVSSVLALRKPGRTREANTTKVSQA